MIDPTVRFATVGDATALAELEREARAALVGKRGGERWLQAHPERGHAWATAIESAVVVVAVIDDVVVGYLVGRVDGTLAVIDEPYVDPEARECGFGDAMLAAALEEFRRLGATTVDAEALPGDRETKNLYERAGIKARLIVVSADL